MSRFLQLLSLSLLAVVAGCDGGPTEVPAETQPPAESRSQCSVTPAQVSTPGSFPALGLGCVAERFTSELWVHEGWAYTGTWGHRGTQTGNALKVWDVSGSAPVLRDSVIVARAGTLGDVQVSDDGRLLVVATEGGEGSIVVYDLGDPARPREIARHSTQNTRAGVHTAELARVGGKLYAFLSIPGESSVVVVDLSDPRSPREVAVRTTGSPFTHDVFVRDGLLFTAGWDDGTTLWDVGGGGKGGSPESPVRIANVATRGGRVHNVWWYHDPSGSKRYLFVGEEGPSSFGSSSSGDIHVVDLEAGSAPREVAFFTVPGAGTHNFSVDEPNGVLYAAYYNGGVRALDVRGELGTCSAEQKDASGRCDLGKMGREVGKGLTGGQAYVWGVQLVGRHLYASDMLNGLWKLDVSSLKR